MPAMAVTPELEAVRHQLRAKRRRGGAEAVPVDDDEGDAAASRGGPGRLDRLDQPDDMAIEVVEVAGRRACWVAAGAEATDRAVLYLPGYAQVPSSPAAHVRLCARLSRAMPARVLVAARTEALERPFLAAVDDAVATLGELERLGLEPGRTVIAGDGAGGGVALAAIVALRQGGHRLPAAVVLLSPWVDLAGRGDSYQTQAELDLVWRPDELRALATLLATGTQVSDPRVSPVGADLTGLPPVLVQVGSDEILLDDSVRLHERLRAAGVDAVLEVWDDMPHAFQFMETLAEAAEAVDRIAASVRRHAAP